MIVLLKHYGPLLRFLHSSIDQSINSALETMELTSAQGHIMGFVSKQNTPPCPKDIEEAFHLSHPTVSGLLSRLEKKDFIQLRTDENDRRCKRIHILPKGRECTARLYQCIVECEERMVSDFTPEERQQFRALLERAIKNMGGLPQCHKEERK